MAEKERQTTVGKVWDFAMSPDGFVACPNQVMDWMSGISPIPGLVEEYADTTGAVLAGRDGFDAHPTSAGSTAGRARSVLLSAGGRVPGVSALYP